MSYRCRLTRRRSHSIRVNSLTNRGWKLHTIAPVRDNCAIPRFLAAMPTIKPHQKATYRNATSVHWQSYRELFRLDRIYGRYHPTSCVSIEPAEKDYAGECSLFIVEFWRRSPCVHRICADYVLAFYHPGRGMDSCFIVGHGHSNEEVSISFFVFTRPQGKFCR